MKNRSNRIHAPQASTSEPEDFSTSESGGCPSTPSSKLSDAGTAHDATRVGIGIRNSKAAELRKDIRSGAAQGAGRGEGVRLASTSQSALASAVLRGRSIDAGSHVLLWVGNVIESAALNENISVLAFEGVTRVVRPVVVDSVEKGAAADL